MPGDRKPELPWRPTYKDRGDDFMVQAPGGTSGRVFKRVGAGSWAWYFLCRGKKVRGEAPAARTAMLAAEDSTGRDR